MGDAGAGRRAHHHRRHRDRRVPGAQGQARVGDARVGQHRRAGVGRRGHGRLRPGREPAHRVRRRRPPLPGIAPGPDGAAGRAGGVAPGDPGLPPAATASSCTIRKACGPWRTWRSCGEHPRGRAPFADRRQAGRGRGRRDVRQRQPGHRGGARPGGGRHRRRHGDGGGRGPAGVRHHRLVRRPRLPARLPAPAPGRPRRRARGAAVRAGRRGRLPGAGHLRAAARRAPAGSADMAGRPDRGVPLAAGHRAQGRLRPGRLPSARCGRSRSGSSG